MYRLKSGKLGFWPACISLLCLACTALEVQAKSGMTDQQVSDKVEDELLFDRGVSSSKIDVITNSGIVTLSGSANNVLSKERAARIAETVKGVRSVVNRIQVKASSDRSDSDIREDVEQALLNDPAADSYEITTTVRNGKVTLEGTVDSYQERDLAKAVAKGVRGVTGIDDQIEVHYKIDRSDAEIEQEVEQSLRWDVHIDDNLIAVSVSDGTVTLSGTVGSAAEKRLAVNTAWAAGVRSVDDSNLLVGRWARDEELRGEKYVIKSESEVRQAIKDALLYDPRVNLFNVDVEVAGRMATLRGVVDNLQAKRAAEQDARNTVGVNFVDNRLKVRLDDPPADIEIADDIRSAFRRDPFVERFEIVTTVVDGTAHLYGLVDSYFEKNRADELASRVQGVVDVENHLNVDDETPYIYDPYVDDGYIDRDELFGYERRSPYLSDSQIKDEINDEMWWSPFVDSEQVNVSVDDGVATLTGAVDSWSERRAATENAYEGGATLVDNELTVNYD